MNKNCVAGPGRYPQKREGQQAYQPLEQTANQQQRTASEKAQKNLSVFSFSCHSAFLLLGCCTISAKQYQGQQAFCPHKILDKRDLLRPKHPSFRCDFTKVLLSFSLSHGGTPSKPARHTDADMLKQEDDKRTPAALCYHPLFEQRTAQFLPDRDLKMSSYRLYLSHNHYKQTPVALAGLGGATPPAKWLKAA